MGKLNARRTPHIMTNRVGIHHPSSFMFFDCETKDEFKGKRKDLSRQRLWFGVAWCFRYENGNVTRSKKASFETSSDWWEIVRSRLDKKRPLYIFSHNLKVDLTWVDFWHTADTEGFNATYYVLEDPPMMLSGYINGCKVYIIDTFNFWKTSVDAMGNSLGIPKLRINLDKASIKEALPYCVRDVEIIANQLMRLLDFLKANDLGTFGMSAARLSMNIFKQRFMTHDIYVHDRERVLELERSSYCGGLVLNFFVGEVRNKHLHQYDVNSLYPFVMRGMFPTRLIESGESAGDVRGIPYERIERMIATVDLCSADTTYPQKLAGRLCEVTGRITTTLAGPELALAWQRGHIRRIRYYALFELQPVFREFVDYFWKLRADYKKQGDKVGEQFVKLVMNSLYGKFAQRGFIWRQYTPELLQDYYDYFGVDMPQHYKSEHFEPSIDGITGEWYGDGLDHTVKLRYVSGRLSIRMPTGEHADSFCGISSFVTSYARSYLRKLIGFAGRGEVLYCDTDSLVVTDKGKANLETRRLIDPTKLGHLKHEGSANYGCFLGPKDYVLGDKVKTKGVSKNAKKKGKGVYEQDQWEGIKSVLARGAEAYIDIKRITKRLKREYTKGVVQASGRTTPFVVSDW